MENCVPLSQREPYYLLLPGLIMSGIYETAELLLVS